MGGPPERLLLMVPGRDIHSLSRRLSPKVRCLSNVYKRRLMVSTVWSEGKAFFQHRLVASVFLKLAKTSPGLNNDRTILPVSDFRKVDEKWDGSNSFRPLSKAISLSNF